MPCDKLKKVLNVVVQKSSYPILIGQQLHTDFASFGIDQSQRVFIVTSENIAQLYLNQIIDTLTDNHVQVDYCIVSDSETCKTVDTWQSIIDTLLRKQHTRRSILLALGGGVIGDLAGFAAATYQRGIDYIQLPTTLLSQVDSSVGGKTAVNHPLGKNMIGSFYQPNRVIIDVDTLKTLTDRQFSSGLAEVIKYGIILDYQFFIWLENNIEKLLNKNEQALIECISHCCKLKADLVNQDEYENGIRAWLNFGHTFGHAIEKLTGFGNWLHGEAVAVGMLMAAHASLLLKLLTNRDVLRIKSLLERANLPTIRPHSLLTEDYLPLMRRDKKMTTSSLLRLVLINQLGRAEVREIDDETVLLKAIESV